MGGTPPIESCSSRSKLSGRTRVSIGMPGDFPNDEAARYKRPGEEGSENRRDWADPTPAMPEATRPVKRELWMSWLPGPRGLNDVKKISSWKTAKLGDHSSVLVSRAATLTTLPNWDAVSSRVAIQVSLPPGPPGRSLVKKIVSPSGA